jgi:ATP-dependent RNA helicase DeaD
LNPTEIQEKAIPFLLEYNSDFIGQAQTGTGKTATFGIPIIQKMDAKNPTAQALILAPTRELCQQIAKQLFKFTKFTNGIYVQAIYGGEKIDIQLKALSRPTQIIVATPGRLLDILERKAVSLTNVNKVVLDEADEMLKMGFQKDVETILQQTHKNSFTWLFSATIPNELELIISKYLSEDVKRIQVNKQKNINEGVEHQYFICDPKLKVDYLAHFLKTQPNKSGIFFTRTKASAQFLTDKLAKMNFSVVAIHGDLEQRDRDKAMRMFKKGTFQFLVATDIAARGIDIDDLSFVVHYELPDDIENYTHRSGRTARAGKKGISIAFIESKEIKRIRKIEQELSIRFHQIK